MYVGYISGPIQLHSSLTDTHVPVEFSESLNAQLQAAGKVAEYYAYENDDHNISNNFTSAMNRPIAFFDTYLKGQ